MSATKFNNLIGSLVEKTNKPFPDCFLDWTYQGCELVDTDKDTGECECGKTGLKTIHKFSYNNSTNIFTIDIGSKCVDKFSYYEALKDIVDECKKTEKKMKKGDCKICGKKHSTNLQSKKLIKQVACSDCYYIKTGKIRCMGKCGYNIPLEKAYSGEYKKICKFCYKNIQQS